MHPKPALLYHGSCKGITGSLTPRTQHGDINGNFPDGPRDVVFATHEKDLAALYTLKTPNMLSTSVDHGVNFAFFIDYDEWKKQIDASASSLYALPSESFTQTLNKDGTPSIEWQSRVAVAPAEVIKYTPEKVMETGAQLFFLDKKITKDLWHYNPSQGDNDTFMNRMMAKMKAGILPNDGGMFIVARALKEAGLLKHLNEEVAIKPKMLEPSPVVDAIREDIEWLKAQTAAKAAPITFALEKISLDHLKLYPKEYQFRLGQAESGEVETHRIKGDRWDPLLHGGTPIYVHKRRDADGQWEYAVVDGHHRVNFAKRLAAEGKLPKDFQLDAYVLEEEKGINTETAKMMLAFKDIAHDIKDVEREPDAAGRKKKNLVQTALVLKEVHEAPDIRQKFMPSLKMDTDYMQMAVKFSGLKKETLSMIATGELPQKVAEMVIRKVKDAKRWDSIMASAVMKLKQEYPNYQANQELTDCLVEKANDNQKSFVGALRAERASAGKSLSLSVN